MATARAVINRALKKLGVLRAGGEAQAEDAADALTSLASLYMEWINAGTFGRVVNIPIERAFDGDAGPNQHLNILTDETVNIALPATVPWNYWCNWSPHRDYGWGLNVPWAGGENVPADKSVVVITSDQTIDRSYYIYDGTVQRWIAVPALLDDESPLSERNMDGLANVLAVRISDLFPDGLQPATIAGANRYRSALVHNYGSEDRDAGGWH